MQDPLDTQIPTTVAVKPEREPIEVSVGTQKAEVVRAEIMPSALSEIKIPQEIEHVIQKVPDVQAPPSVRSANQAGIQPAKEAAPVITTPNGTIRLPMTYPQALQEEMKTPFSDSMHWLAAMIMYQWSKYDPDAVNETKNNKSTSK